MLPKSVLLGLVGLVAVTDALVTPYGSVVDRRSKRQALSARQFGGGGGFRGGNGGNGGNNNNNGGQQGGNNGGQQGGNNNNNGGGGNNNGGNNNLCLDPSVLATNANNNGLANAEPGQAASATDAANFINFCKDKTITNGKQERGGSCNPIPMGEIPSADRMISAVFQNPKNGDTVQENQTFDISVQVTNLQAGTFTNPQETYYNAPQALGNGGQIVGHTHVVVQDMGNSQNPNTPPSAATFAFFKGINDAGNNQGLLSATVQGGLPAGNYRLCSMTAAANHQPVLMPVAQRGPQDDCVRFTVGGGGGGGGGNNGGGNNNNNGGGNNGGQQGGNNGGNNGGQQGGNNGGQQGGNNGGQQGGNNGGQQGGNNGGQQGGNNGGRGGGGGGQQGAFGGAAPAVTQSGNGDRPFAVNGNTFVNEAAAKERACDIQNNACSDAVNRGGAAFKLSDCTTQQQACIAA